MALSKSTQALTLLLLFLSLLLQVALSQTTPAADPPIPGGPLNITGILDKGGQFSTFIRLLKDTQTAAQIINQLNNSAEGMTVFAPTDNAFAGLKAGALNGLSTADQVRLVQAHILPKYYTLSNLLTISNPVRTQATADDGFPFGLNFTGAAGNQVNVSTGVVNAPVNTPLARDPPLAVYQVDAVLLPEELFGDKPRKRLAPAPAKTAAGGNGTTPVAKAAPAPVAEAASDVSGAAVVGAGGALGVVVGVIGMLCMGVFV